MKDLLKFFILLIISCTAAGCSPPTGSIGDSAAHDSLLPIPKQVAYEINETFNPGNDLSIIAMYQGVIEEVAIDRVNIAVVENPDSSDASVPVPNGEQYLFSAAGRKLIVVKYLSMSTSYSVNVTDPYGVGGENGNSGNNGSEGGSGIIIVGP